MRCFNKLEKVNLFERWKRTEHPIGSNASQITWEIVSIEDRISELIRVVWSDTFKAENVKLKLKLHLNQFTDSFSETNEKVREIAAKEMLVSIEFEVSVSVDNQKTLAKKSNLQTSVTNRALIYHSSSCGFESDSLFIVAHMRWIVQHFSYSVIQFFNFFIGSVLHLFLSHTFNHNNESRIAVRFVL